MRIFEPTMTDVHLLIPQIRKLIQAYEGPLDIHPLTTVRACFRAAENPSAYLAFAMTDTDELVGYFMGCMTVEMFTGRTIASQIGMLLLPQYRGAMNGFLARFSAWAKDHKAKCLYIHFSNHDDRRNAVLARKGWKTAEVHYMKEVEHGR